MKVGLLWYDSDPRRQLEDKIDRAAERYREKFGRWPNTCFVHPGAMDGQAPRVLSIAARGSRIRVMSAPNILLHHLWLGISKGEDAGQRAAPPN